MATLSIGLPDASMAVLSRQYLDRRKPTIAFACPPSAGGPVSGDVYVGAEGACQYAGPWCDLARSLAAGSARRAACRRP